VSRLPDEPTRAELKAELARLGQSMAPNARLTRLDRPKGRTSVVLIDRVVKDHTPDYDVYGYVECARCYHMCYLGDKTLETVESGTAAPLCLTCGDELDRDGALNRNSARYHVNDHRRK
jgi:hypothetical protein